MKTKSSRFSVLATLLLFCCFGSFAAQTKSATIKDFWIERTEVNGESGIKAHVDFSVNGMKGKEIIIKMCFFDENCRLWAGTYSNKYCSDWGDIINVKRTCTPKYDYSGMNDFTLFIPDKYLQYKAGMHVYYCQVSIESVYYSKYHLVSSDFRSFYGIGDGRNSGATYAELYALRSSYSNSNSSYKSKKSTVSTFEAALAMGTIAALGYGLYKVFSKDDSSSSSSSSSGYSRSSSSTKEVYYFKKYTSEDVARLLNGSGPFYACRFEEGSNCTKIAFVTRAKIVNRNGSRYISLPDYLSGVYKLEHGYHRLFGASCIYMSTGGDNYYLMDSKKNIIVY